MGSWITGGRENRERVREKSRKTRGRWRDSRFCNYEKIVLQRDEVTCEDTGTLWP